MFITILEDVPFPIIPNICFLNLPLIIIRTVLKKVKDFFSTCSVMCSVNQRTEVTVNGVNSNGTEVILTNMESPVSPDNFPFRSAAPDLSVWHLIPLS